MRRILAFALILALAAPVAVGQKAKKNRAPSRYGVSLTQQEDGSWTADKKVMSLLDGARPEGFFEPYKGTPFIAPESIADVPCEEVVYKTYPDRKLVMYICRAMGVDGPAPVVCHIHGGGWRSGHPKGFVPKLKYIAKYCGLAGVSIQYTLEGQEGATITVTLQDLHDAVQYLRDHAAEYNLDTRHLAFAGHSAGGHLSAMMAMTEPDAKVLSGWAGPYNLVSELKYWKDGPSPAMQRYFYGGKVRKIRSVSPIYLIPKKRQVAVQLFQGTCDPLVHYTQALDFEAALKKAGQKTVECNIYEYYGHSITSASCDKSEDLFFKFIQFVKDHIYD